MYNHILSESNGEIHKITVNRPSQLNALNKETIAELGKALQLAEEKDKIKVIILLKIFINHAFFITLLRNGFAILLEIISTQVNY